MIRSLAASLLLLAAGPTSGEIDVLVVFQSHSGHTRAMAEAVGEGARSVPESRVKLAAVSEAKIDDVLGAEAIVVGSPVHNGNVAPEVQLFINRWPFEGAPLRDKIGAAFVTAGGISAGEETAQLSILRSMLCFGMIVIGGPHWTSSFGASAITAEEPFSSGDFVDERFLRKARDLGRRVAETAQRLQARPAEQETEPSPSP